MAVTLAQAQANVQDDVDFAVIDNLRRYSWLFDQMVFDDTVSPGTGGGTLTYGYTLLTTPRSANFRQYNNEYNPDQAVRQRKTVDLKPLGGSFALDRVLADLGPAATNEITFQMQQLLTGVRMKFSDAIINGDTAVDAAGFDGLDKLLTGESTEYLPSANGYASGYLDWTPGAINSQSLAMAQLDVLDDFLSKIIPSHTGSGDLGAQGALPAGVRALVGNTKSITRARALARWASMYQVRTDELGRRVETYGDWTLVDAGDGPLGASPIVPIETRDPDEARYTLTVTGTPTGGSFTLSATVQGVTQTTAAIAYNASASAVQSALAALSNIGSAAGNVAVGGAAGGPYSVVFAGRLDSVPVQLTANGAGLTGGTSPTVTAAATGGGNVTGVTDLYAVCFGLDAFHGAAVAGKPLVQTWMPDRATAGAVKLGEVEMGPCAPVLRNTKSCGVLRNVKVS